MNPLKKRSRKMRKVYLDNGATTRVDERVAKAMLPYFTKYYGNASSIHQFGSKVEEDLKKARETIAKEINAEADEIIFTSGGTESDNLAIKGIVEGKKGKIITSKIEHPAVLETCKYLEKKGYEVKYLDVDREGFVKLKDLEKEIDKNTLIVSIMHANNEIGVIQDIAKIGEICRKKKVVFHTDAVQSFKKIKIDVKKMNLDLVSLSAHKINGPKGIGALYVREGLGLKPLFHGGHQEFGLRVGTENIAGIIGFAEAVKLQMDVEKIKKLRDKLIGGILKKIPNTKLNGSREKRICNNANISFENVEGESILMHLDFKGIAVSTGSACMAKDLKPSHVLTAMGLNMKECHGSIRFSLDKFSTEEDVNYLLDVLPDIIKKLREISPLK